MVVSNVKSYNLPTQNNSYDAVLSGDLSITRSVLRVRSVCFRNHRWKTQLNKENYVTIPNEMKRMCYIITELNHFISFRYC